MTPSLGPRVSVDGVEIDDRMQSIAEAPHWTDGGTTDPDQHDDQDTETEPARDDAGDPDPVGVDGDELDKAADRVVYATPPSVPGSTTTVDVPLPDDATPATDRPTGDSGRGGRDRDGDRVSRPDAAGQTTLDHWSTQEEM